MSSTAVLDIPVESRSEGEGRENNTRDHSEPPHSGKGRDTFETEKICKVLGPKRSR